MIVKVLAATQSPMNSRRWLLDLSCGHGKWVTQLGRPKVGKKVDCPTCEESK